MRHRLHKLLLLMLILQRKYPDQLFKDIIHQLEIIIIIVFVIVIVVVIIIILIIVIIIINIRFLAMEHYSIVETTNQVLVHMSGVYYQHIM
jgi:hypothetical protein